MDQKSESVSVHGRLTWMIATWYLFVLWSWSVPLYGRNEELFAISLVIMMSGIVLAVVSFARFLYELRRSAQRQSLPDNDFFIRVLIDLGALTVLSRFSVTMNRVAEGFDEDAVLLLVSGIIMLTLIYGVVRVVIGISTIRVYFVARWCAVAVLLLAMVIGGAWHDVLRSVQLAMAVAGVEGAANAIPQSMALNALWYDGYVFSLALLTVFLIMLAASWRQFRMIYFDVAGLAAKMTAGLSRPLPAKKPKAPEREVATVEAAAVPRSRAAVKRR